MARDLSPITKRSRRERVALHPKSEVILTKRNYPPGEHGLSTTRSKPSQYAAQLREKQKVKRMYGLLERQFASFVKEADRQTGATGENLLKLLEQRLDNVIYRLGLTVSRRASRQMVSHGHILLNDRRVTIPSIRVEPGDEITIRPKSRKNLLFTQLNQEVFKNNSYPNWLKFDPKKLTAKVTGIPDREEIDQDINEQLIIEYYSR